MLIPGLPAIDASSSYPRSMAIHGQLMVNAQHMDQNRWLPWWYRLSIAVNPVNVRDGSHGGDKQQTLETKMRMALTTRRMGYRRSRRCESEGIPEEHIDPRNSRPVYSSECSERTKGSV